MNGKVGQYILDGEGNPVPCEDIEVWGRFLANKGARVLAQDTLPGDVLVSTVFLGLETGRQFSGRR